ncbi:MAG: nucleotide exchange factor GrpE [bacterium]
MSSNESVEPEVQAEEDALDTQADAQEQDVSEELAQAKAEAAENWEKVLRLQAEMENLRRRSAQDVEKAHKFALDKFVNDLLPVKDSLEMGIDAGKATELAEVEKILEGVELTLKMLEDVLGKHGVETVNPEGEKFDPQHHQAMSIQDSDEHDPNTVMTVMQKGYKLNDRLVRPAMVVVSK